MAQIPPIRGMNDVLPAEAPVWQFLENTARDIGNALGRSLEVVHTSVVRPNLRYDVQEVANAEDRIEILVERLGALRGGSAIVYARSRRSTLPSRSR